MTNKIISYQSLKGEVKKAFKNWLQQKDPDLVSFPFKGQHVKGYIFDYETCKYLVIMYLSNNTPNSLDIAFVNEDL